MPKNERKHSKKRGRNMMDYAKTASLVIKYVGGKDNIKSVTHCATRLRFQLRDAERRGNQRPGRGKRSVSHTIPVPDYIWFRYCEYGLR